MKRTRKWAFVGQEAIRLAALGLTPKEIAAKIGVRKSTVTRWMASGKITSTRKKQVDQYKQPRKPPNSAAKWAAEVRHTYALDATDEQLVKMAQAAAETALDTSSNTPLQVKLQAAGRFQSIVKQLALVARSADQPVAPDTPAARPARAMPRRASGDPRALLSMVKS